MGGEGVKRGRTMREAEATKRKKKYRHFGEPGSLEAEHSKLTQDFPAPIAPAVNTSQGCVGVVQWFPFLSTM